MHDLSDVRESAAEDTFEFEDPPLLDQVLAGEFDLRWILQLRRALQRCSAIGPDETLGHSFPAPVARIGRPPRVRQMAAGADRPTRLLSLSVTSVELVPSMPDIAHVTDLKRLSETLGEEASLVLEKLPGPKKLRVRLERVRRRKKNEASPVLSARLDEGKSGVPLAGVVFDGFTNADEGASHWVTLDHPDWLDGLSKGASNRRGLLAVQVTDHRSFENGDDPVQIVVDVGAAFDRIDAVREAYESWGQSAELKRLGKRVSSANLPSGVDAAELVSDAWLRATHSRSVTVLPSEDEEKKEFLCRRFMKTVERCRKDAQQGKGLSGGGAPSGAIPLDEGAAAAGDPGWLASVASEELKSIRGDLRELVGSYARSPFRFAETSLIADVLEKSLRVDKQLTIAELHFEAILDGKTRTNDDGQPKQPRDLRSKVSILIARGYLIVGFEIRIKMRTARGIQLEELKEAYRDLLALAWRGECLPKLKCMVGEDGKKHKNRVPIFAETALQWLNDVRDEKGGKESKALKRFRSEICKDLGSS